MRLVTLATCMGMLLAWAGCTKYQAAPVPPPAQPTAQSASPAPAAKAPAPAAPAQSGMNASMTAMGAGIGMAPLETAVGGPAAVAAAPTQQPAAQPAAQPPSPPPGMVQEKAEVGFGKKGQGYGTGIVATPMATKYRAEERISVALITDAINKYDALNGHPPQSHDEFMKMVQEWKISLPELPAGERYVYNPADKQLYVEKPKK